MTAAFLFLLSRSLKNRVLSRFRRLRNPKYMVSALAGLAYLYFVFLHQPFIHGLRMRRNQEPPDPGMLVLAEAGFALMLMLPMVLQWIVSTRRTPLFNEAEVQFLFCAPVSRSALLNYRIARAQIGIFFGSVISVILFGRGRIFSNPVFMLIAVGAIYSFLYLYHTAVALEIQRLERKGIKGRQRRTWIVAGILILLILVAAAARSFYPGVPAGSEATPENLIAWFAGLAESGPVFYVLFPFRLLVRPAFASGLSQFLLWLGPALLMIAAVYAWILRSGAGLEAAAVGQPGSEETAAAFTGRGGRKTVLKPRRPPFHLEPDGSAPIGIYWKNLSLIGGLSLRRVFPGLMAAAVVLILVISMSGRQAPTVVGSLCAGLALFLAFMGPVLFRDDLRTDLQNIELLKAYPVRGWGIVLGEALAPATVLALLEWLLILVGVALMPDIEEHSWKVSQRIYAGIAAGLLMPCLGFIGILVQNAAVLLLPGWIQLGREHQRGVEAMGQRLIASLATMISLLIAAIPAALLFLATWVAGHWLIGLAVVPVAAFVAALGLLAEAAIGIFWLGRVFDKFDASKELG